MKLLFKIVMIFVIINMTGENALAGGPPNQPGGGGGGPTCWPPPCVPIDEQLGFLLIAGLAFGGKKAFDLSKEKNA